MSAGLRPSGLAFLDVLNETSVIFVVELGRYGWDLTGPGWEATSPFGEIRAFETEREARIWRNAECRTAFASRLKLAMNAIWGRDDAWKGGQVWPAEPYAVVPFAGIQLDVNSLYPSEFRGEL